MEARWAVFFDTLGIEYEYEKEGFDLGDAGWYLPDFWLPQVNMWAEVKGKEFTSDELLKCHALAAGSRHECVLLCGMPSDNPQTMVFRVPDEYTDPQDEIRLRKTAFMYRIGNHFFGAEDVLMRLYKGRSYKSDDDTCVFDVSTGFIVGTDSAWADSCIESAGQAVIAARSARFEHKNKELND